MISENKTLTRNETRELDLFAIEKLKVPSIVLMENAGHNIANYLIAQKISGSVLICCGKGNNGGDGLVIARHLNNHNINAEVLLFADPDELSVDAKINYNILINMGLPVILINEKNFSDMKFKISCANWIVDALFGTGLSGKVNNFHAQVIQEINSAKSIIAAVDIPSGLDCDTGNALGIAIKAEYTLTLVSLKKGFSNPESKQYLGKISVFDIGVNFGNVIA